MKTHKKDWSGGENGLTKTQSQAGTWPQCSRHFVHWINIVWHFIPRIQFEMNKREEKPWVAGEPARPQKLGNRSKLLPVWYNFKVFFIFCLILWWKNRDVLVNGYSLSFIPWTLCFILHGIGQSNGVKLNLKHWLENYKNYPIWNIYIKQKRNLSKVISKQNV